MGRDASGEWGLGERLRVLDCRADEGDGAVGLSLDTCSMWIVVWSLTWSS
jgi:hypothetical protein